ncbi:MAG: hypothetical protein V7720_18750, partial [Halioglobus sp.]
FRLRTVGKNSGADITAELTASGQQTFAGVCLCVTKSAYRHTVEPGFSHPLGSVEYDCYDAHWWSIG